jgi:hypothetical protein
MVSPQEEVQCMLWYKGPKSVVTNQRNVRWVYQKDATTDKHIHMWYEQVQETGGVLNIHQVDQAHHNATLSAFD